MTLARKSFASKPRKPMKQISDERLEQFGGRMPFNSLEKPGAEKPAWKPKRHADTGPKQSQVDLLFKRSLRICEWPGCWQPATDKHHRLNRKDGGRHGEMRDRLNGVAWLLHACRVHHAYVTSPHGFRRRKAMEMGWLLLENQDALRVAVITRHHDQPVWLLPTGKWLKYEEACA